MVKWAVGGACSSSGLWQLLVRVGIGAPPQSYNCMPDLATWTPTRRSHQATSRSQARAEAEHVHRRRDRLAQYVNGVQIRRGSEHVMGMI